MDRWLINAPRWLLLGTLVYAPWAYGTTPLWAVDILNILLAICLGLWVVTCLLRRAWPSVHPVPAVLMLALLAQACFMIFNARYNYDSVAHEFIPLNPFLSWGAGSLHRELSIQTTLQVAAMLGALALSCDMARHREWRARLLLTIAATGASIALLGLMQKFTHASAIFWGSEDMGNAFFATYRYHGNAGAFLNVIWPIVAGFAAVAFLRPSSNDRLRVTWTIALVICLAAVFVNTSRAAGALGLVLAVLGGGWILWQMVRGRLAGFSAPVAAITGLILLGFVAVIAAMAGLDTSLKRWGRFGLEVNERNPRLLATMVCLDMVPQAGCMGFGPGTFQTTFPYFTERFGNKLRGRWLYAHQDYLQTQIEWGYVGGVLWGLLVFGGILYSMHRAWRHRASLTISTQITHRAILFAWLGVLLHALVDFPMQIASIQLYLMAMLGLLWGSKHWLKRDPRAAPPASRSHSSGRRSRHRGRGEHAESESGRPDRGAGVTVAPSTAETPALSPQP
jgi:O-antigen ligase